MPVTWKKTSRFKPEVVLNKIASVRTVNPEGGASFAGFELEECLPALQSMLNFPDAASEVDAANLVWHGLSKIEAALTPANFLAAVNAELSNRLSKRETTFFFLTSLSVDSRDLPKSISIFGAIITIYPKGYPKKYVESRKRLLQEHRLSIYESSDKYCSVVVKVKAKDVKVAVNRALRAIDLQRSLWCLMGNSRMQLSFGSAKSTPINVARLGSRHTLHLEDGSPATDGIWYEPNFIKADIFRPKNYSAVQSNSRWVLKRIQESKYGDKICTSLLRFVRAFDEAESNTAFLRLWGSIETLTTPGVADYDKLVQRCSFLFKEGDYHRQILEHLREYRNASVHAGEESERARTHCYQLQLYFVNLIWFHLNNAKVFASLDEANNFLDLPANIAELTNRLRLTKKALKFIK